MVGEGKVVDVVYMNCSKAFDKVPHGRLVQKVKSNGIRGSVLGPLLFVVYINDLEENVASLISKFADNTKIGGVVDSEEDCRRIQQYIDQLEAWAEKRQVKFNPDKCEKDVDALGRVQKRFTRMLPGMGDFSSEERLDRLGLFSLECKRLRGDLIEVNKIVNGMDRAE
eukprot:g25185.t1